MNGGRYKGDDVDGRHCNILLTELMDKFLIKSHLFEFNVISEIRVKKN